MGRNYDLMRDAAYTRKGAEMHNTILAWEATKRIAPVLFAGALLGGVGYAAYTVWTALTSMTVPDAGSLPGLVWAALVALPVGLIAIFRPGRMVVFPVRRVFELLLLLIVVAALLGFGLSSVV